MPEEPSILDYLKSRLKFWERGGKIELPAEPEPPKESSTGASQAVVSEPAAVPQGPVAVEPAVLPQQPVAVEPATLPQGPATLERVPCLLSRSQSRNRLRKNLQNPTAGPGVPSLLWSWLCLPNAPGNPRKTGRPPPA